MKSATILMLSFIALLFVACESDGKGGNTDSSNELDTQSSTEQPMVTPPADVNAGGNSGVQHYTCPNNCEGSGGPAPGDCPVCGTAYAHNAAYHDQPGMEQPQQPQAMPGAPQQQPQATPGAPQQQPQATPGAPQQQPQAMPGAPQPAAEPAQNAAGVWHYTCSAGCAGGAGSAGNCANCGNALQHNQAYHQ